MDGAVEAIGIVRDRDTEVEALRVRSNRKCPNVAKFTGDSLAIRGDSRQS